QQPSPATWQHPQASQKRQWQQRRRQRHQKSARHNPHVDNLLSSPAADFSPASLLASSYPHPQLPPGLIDITGRRFPQLATGVCRPRDRSLNVYLIRCGRLDGRLQQTIAEAARLLFTICRLLRLSGGVARLAVEIFCRLLRYWICVEWGNRFPFRRSSQVKPCSYLLV
ncbi:hypothetical protein BOX15_Mlig013458g1, partial [Macrostomum lignano]